LFDAVLGKAMPMEAEEKSAEDKDKSSVDVLVGWPL
jgi:hypothetical protein